MTTEIQPRPPQAFDLQNILDARSRLSLNNWRRYTDDLLIYFSREYLLQQDITTYHYDLKLDEHGRPYQVLSPAALEEGGVINSFAGNFRTNSSRIFGQREEAEYLGFTKIEAEIFSGRGSGRFFVWDSEPGSREEGYGTHAFTFIGQVLDDRINMLAYKNWLPVRKKVEFLNQFLDENQKLKEDASALDLLTTPVFLPGSRDFQTHIEVVMALNRGESLTMDDQSQIITQMDPFRKSIVSALEIGDLEGAKRAKRAHDNYALALINGEQIDGKSNDYWALLPNPVLRGSCGFEGVEAGFGSGLTYLGLEAKDWTVGNCRGSHDGGCNAKGVLVGPCRLCQNCDHLYKVGIKK